MNLPPFKPAEWMDQAECAKTGEPDAWFPESGDAYGHAIRTCHTCPVRDLCLQAALDNNEQHGIWGGLTPNERRELKRGNPPRKPKRNTRRKVRLEDIEFLLSVDHAVTLDWLADRFGVKRDSVQAVLRRAARWDLVEQLRRNGRAVA